MHNIYFHSADRAFRFRGKKQLKTFVASVFEAEKKEFIALNYIFCSDDYLLGINKSFLQHDYYTDIITFNLAETKKAIEGEIYISLDRVKENAATLEINQKEELLRVLFHGALHLCGYGDKKKSEIILMRKKEDHYLLLFKKNFTTA